MHPDPSRQTALITGASGGIGEELARLCARDHYNLVLVARSADKLQTLADQLSREHSIQAQVVAVDLSDPRAVDDILTALHSRSIEIDVLVNNAGFGTYGPFAETNPDNELRMIQVNVTALTHLTRMLLSGMLARRRGKVLNVASTAAFQPGPLMAVYYASKAYVLSFSEAIANEVAGTGVTVTCLCPGPTPTGFQARARMEGAQLLRSGLMLDAATVARIGYEGMGRGKTIVIPGLKNRLLVQVVRLSPRGFVTRMVRRLMDRRTP